MRALTVTSPSRGVIRGRLAAAAVALVAVVAATLTPMAAYADGTGSISGNVTDSNWDALSGVTVSLVDDTLEQVATTTTDSSGNWSITGVDDGTYKVHFTKAGHVGEWWQGASSAYWSDSVGVYGDAVTDIDAHLNEGASLYGTVTANADGAPLAGVDVYIVDTSGSCAGDTGNALSSYCARTTTNSAGEYYFDTLAGGFYNLYFDAPGFVGVYNGGVTNRYLAEDIEVEWAGSTSGHDIALLAEATVSGTVLAPGSVPVEGATVQVSTTAGMYVSDARTDGSGNYTVGDLLPGTYKVQVYADGFLTAFWSGSRLGNSTHLVLSAGQARTGISVTLDRGASISGTITASGSPMPNVYVDAYDSRGQYSGHTKSREDGTYTLSGLPAGSFTVLAGDWDSEAAVCVVGTYFGGSTNYDSATYFAVASHGNVTAKNIVMTRCGTISGTVTGAGSGALDRVPVRFYDANRDFFDQTETDETGHYAMNLPPGTYYVEAEPSDSVYAPKFFNGSALITSATAQVLTATGTRTADFVLPIGATISGNVKQAPSTNLDDAYVIAYGQNTGNSYYASADEFGNYTLVGLPADTYKVLISGFAFSGLVAQWWNNATTEAAATPITVALGNVITGKNAVLSIGGTIEGQVTDSVGEPLGGVTVAALNSAGVELRATSSNADGSYYLQAVPAGTITLKFSAYTYWGVESVEFWDNKTTRATANTFTVTNGATITGKNAAMPAPVELGSIAGQVIDPVGDDLDSITVGAFKQNGSAFELYSWAITDGDGNYEIPGLAAGSYRLGFSDYGTGASFASTEATEFKVEFWDNKTTLAASNAIAVGSGSVVTGKDAQLAYVGALLDLTSATPTIAGTQAPGQTLSVAAGTWGPSPVTLTYQWKRDGSEIAGKTAAVYPVTVDDLGHTLSVSVTGTKSGYTTVTKTSAETPPITGVITAPVPTITGNGAVGQTLTAVPGTWAPVDVSLSYQWLRNGVAIEGATSSTYLVDAADAGTSTTVAVTGAKENYASQTKTSVGKPIGNVLTTATPTFTGIPTVGKPLTAVAGTWGPAPVTLAYQWKRDGTPIAGALSAVYTATAADSGKTLSVTVTGTKAGYTTVALSSGTVTIGNAFTAAPVPTIAGTPTAGTELTATVGTWAPAPVTLAYQWLKNGSPIAGETGTSYTPTTADATSSITFAVTATKAGFTPVTVTSAPKVIGLPFSDIGIPSISGQNTVGQVLTADPGVWGPDPVTFGYQWNRAGVAIAGATAQSYTPVVADGGKQLTVTVTGIRASYFSVAVTSAPTLVNFALTTVAPTVTGIPTVGQRLTAVAGAWAPAPVVLAYQWYRDGTPIAGATATSYLLTSADNGTIVTVRVTGTKAGYTSVVRTNEGSLIGVALGTPPVPTITGLPAIGSTLTAVSAAWTPAPVDLSYQWKRAGVAIAGATASEYTLVAADLAKAITVTVTGSKSGYTSASATSAAVTAASALVTTVPTITGTPAVGSTLTAVAGSWTPAPVVLSYKWLRNGVAITGATAATYKLVAADAGQSITVVVTGTKAGYATVTLSSIDLLIQSLITTSIPTISGTGIVGDELVVVTGTWGPLPLTFSSQWNRAGVPIAGATENNYTTETADIGKAITVTVTAVKPGYTTASATSAPRTINNRLTAPPVPTVTGTPAVGSTLTAVAGTWAPAPVALVYMWLRNGVPITGATLSTYKLVAADAGKTINVAVTGVKAGYAATTMTSDNLDIESLLATATPQIVGVPSVGTTLTVNAGTWGPAPVDLSYQWKRAGVVIPGATLETFELGSSDLAKAITVTVTGTKAGYTPASTTSAAVTVGLPLTATPIPTITGTLAVGSTLTAVAGTWSPAPVTLSYKWLRNGVVIPGATLATYKLVAADAGQTVGVQVTGTKAGYATETRYTESVVESLLTTAVPTITGTPTVFDTLTAVAGAWGPDVVDLTYQWKRAGVAIAGETGPTYTLQQGDAGKAITVTVTGTKEGFTSASVTSAAKTISALLPDPPTPSITGTPVVGSTLTAVAGTWTPAPVVLSYKWLRNGTAITGATASTYKLVAADAGQLITLVVTGTKAGYAVASRYSSDLLIESLLTAPIPTIAGTPTVEETLTAVPGEWGPAPVDLTYQWKRAGVVIPGETDADFELTTSDIGKAITVTVTGTKAGFTSASTTSVAKTIVAKLTATPVPTITGTPAVGSTLTAVPGTWGLAPVVLSYKWLRNGVAITGATAATYKLVAADAGQTITVAVTGTKAGYATVVQTSAGTAIQALLTTVVPTIAGTATVNETLTAVAGSWAFGPDLSYQWNRGGVAIAGATSVSYQLQTADGGKAITVTVTGTKLGYTAASATSAAKTITSVLTATPVPTVAGTPVVGSTLTATAGAWTPAPVVLTYKWLRNGVPITGATLATYKLVTADAGQNVTVEVTGTKVGFAPVVQSSSVVAVQPLVVAAVPTITGSGTVEEQLTVVPGTWSPELVDLSIQWNKGGVPIAGATFANYTPVNADLGKVITVTVTGTKAGHTTASATSAGKTVTLPLTSSLIPTVTGTPAVGSTLTVVPGTWTPAPVVLSYKWLRNGVAITGATATTYKLVAADAGQAITAVVTGTKAGYTTVVQPSLDTMVQSLLTTAVPTVSGVGAVGNTLTASPGAWAPGSVDYAYQWKRAGVVIAGATGSDYTLVAADAGLAITVTVTGSKSGYTSASTVSAALVPYAAAPLPTVSGGSTIGSVLTATPGTWATAPVTLAYQWNRNGTAITGATAATYTLTAADLGSTISVSVTGTKAGYAALKRTSSSGIYAQYGLIAAPRPSIDGDAVEGATLTANYGAWGPSPVTLEFQWFSDGVAIEGATETTYVVDVPSGSVITVRVTGSKTNYLTVAKLSPGVTVYTPMP